jgi:DNA-binding response OmpR family regulator
VGEELALVIEDNTDISALFSLVLEEAGFQVEIISAGDTAIKRLTEVVPSVVILDLHLPSVQGDVILHNIRADAKMADTHVLVITAYATLAKTLQDEADVVLIKPVSLSLLRSLVTRLRAPGGLTGDIPSIIGPGYDPKTLSD